MKRTTLLSYLDIILELVTYPGIALLLFTKETKPGRDMKFNA